MSMEKFCVFAGTTEGRELTEFLISQGAGVTACVATEYGEALLTPAEGLCIRSGRLDAAEMAQMLEEGRFDLVLDATHPYASEVTGNIVRACTETGTEYLRVLREEYSFYGTLERAEKDDDPPLSEEMLRAAADLEDQLRALLITYLGVDPSDADRLRELTDAQRRLLLETAWDARKGDA